MRLDYDCLEEALTHVQLFTEAFSMVIVAVRTFSNEDRNKVLGTCIDGIELLFTFGGSVESSCLIFDPLHVR